MSSSFLIPTIFNQKIVDFLTNAHIGPLIDAHFLENQKPDINTLQSTQQRLNDMLNFTKCEIDGRSNVNYRIINPGSLTSLFVLHAYYADMQHVNDGTRLSASKEMRQYLRQTMIKIIDKDCDFILSPVHPDNDSIIQEVNETKQKMIDCIDNPNDLSLKGNKYYIGYGNYLEVLNPNWFLYAHFSKIISAAKPSMGSLMCKQQKLISLACSYKNN